MRPTIVCCICLTALLLLGQGRAARADFVVSAQDRSAFRLPSGNEAVDRAIERFKRRDYDGASAELETAARGRTDLVPARLMLAKLFLMDEQTAVGKDMLERAAIENPDHPDVYVTLGKVAVREGRLTDAALQFEKALGLCSSPKISIDLARICRIDCQAGRADVAERRRDWQTAEAALGAWLAIEPGNALAHRRLAIVLFRSGRKDQAVKELEAAVKADPHQEPPAMVMGQLYSEAGEAEKAAEAFEAAGKAAPKDARVAIAYAAWLLDQGKLDQALDRAQTAVALAPDSQAARELEGRIAWTKKDYVRAEAVFQALHIEAPGNFAFSNIWALILAERPDDAGKQRARQLAELNARLNPNSAEALSTLGWVAYRQGQADDALRYLRAALNSGRAPADAAYFLARLLADRGQADEARTLVKLAVDAKGPHPYRQDARELSDRLDKAQPKTPKEAPTR
jgi:Tfp pilus assembly protein PilF